MEKSTLRGKHMHVAREELMQSDLAKTSKTFPNYLGRKSDSASMDMVIELLLMTGPCQKP
jgi:glutamate synthase (ferredoxin)